MQICTAQHLISHLSVKVPSVGSPGGPGLMSWRVPDRNMQKEEERGRAKETVKEKEEGGRSKQFVLLQTQGSAIQSSFYISLKVQRQMQETFAGNKWVNAKSRRAAIICLNLY